MVSDAGSEPKRIVYDTSRPAGAEPTVRVAETLTVAVVQESTGAGPVTLSAVTDRVGGGEVVVGGGAGLQAAGAVQVAEPVRMLGLGPSTSKRTFTSPAWVALTWIESSVRAPVPLMVFWRFD